jgi:signal transduction histidine kinase
MPEAVPALVRSFRRASRVLGAVVAAIGALAVAAWIADGPIAPALAVPQLNSGVAFALAGAALVLARRPRVARGCALAVAVMGAVMVVQHLGGWHLGRALLADPGAQMEPETAVAFTLVGVALALVARAPRLSQALAIATILVGLVALFGQLYSVKFFFGITAYTRMTLTASLAFILLGLAILFAAPTRGLMATVVSDSAGGVMARRLYPAALATPLALSWLILVGEHARLYNGKFGLSLLALSSVVSFVVLISLTYRSLDRADDERMRLAAILLEEAERRHVARELHDEIGQTLTALKLHLEAASETVGVAQARALVRDLMTRVSNLSLDLRPAMLDDLGLLPALLWLFERYSRQTSVVVKFEHQGIERRFAAELETAAFRIVQEALTNVARHAAVESVVVRVWANDAALGVQVEDAGRGFDAAAALGAGASSGLMGMRERASALGGELTIESSPGAGARLSAEVPLRARLAT